MLCPASSSASPTLSSEWTSMSRERPVSRSSTPTSLLSLLPWRRVTLPATPTSASTATGLTASSWARSWIPTPSELCSPSTNTRLPSRDSSGTSTRSTRREFSWARFLPISFSISTRRSTRANLSQQQTTSARSCSRCREVNHEAGDGTVNVSTTLIVCKTLMEKFSMIPPVLHSPLDSLLLFLRSTRISYYLSLLHLFASPASTSPSA
mmetsp:Transcript_28132/g.91198  ORF Transcript_28132/g.91198 Transcript_28132/m.91198 type:complete len:209 (-) Transcript_28132:34-660(-)